MSIESYSLNRPKVVWFFVAVLLVGGIVSFERLGKKEDSPFVIKSAVLTVRMMVMTAVRVMVAMLALGHLLLLFCMYLLLILFCHFPPRL
jgi:hypothetical protein